MKKNMQIVFLITIFIVLNLHSQDFDTLPLGSSPLKLKLSTISSKQIISSRDGKSVTLPQLAAAIKSKRIIVVGESHDSMACHQFQANLIRELHKQNPKIIVGFEFFQRQETGLLQDWITGKISEKELLEKVKWYKRSSLNYGYTRKVMEVIKELKINAIGLNVPRKILRTISRQGFKTLPQNQKNLFPGIDKHLPDHGFFIRSVFGEMAVISDWWFQRVFSAQKGWDIIMAESMLKELAKKENRKSIGIIIAGSNHVKYSLGIPFRLKLRGKRYKTATLIPIHLPAPKDDKEKGPENPMLKMLKKTSDPTVVFSRGIGNYVFSIPSPQFPHYPRLDIQGRMNKDGYQITWVEKEGLAKKHGLAKGDTIQTMDGHKLDSKETMNKILAAKKWGDSLTINVSKKINLIKSERESQRNK